MMEPPKILDHATATNGARLTIFEDTEFGHGRVAFDEDGGGPYVPVTGCPNCRKHADEWWDPMTFFGSLNAGFNPNDPCSRVCKYQLEWQAEIAARELTKWGRA